MGNVDLGTGAVVVRRGKGSKQRLVFLGTRAMKALVRYLRHRGCLADEAPLWATTGGGRSLTYSGLRDILRRRARDARVPAPTLHAFGRAFALLALQAGADIYGLQSMMGHSSLHVLRRYLKQSGEHLLRVHRRSSPVDHAL